MLNKIVEKLQEQRQVELAKEILENKGYNVKKIKESSDDLQKYAVVVAIGNSDGDGETGMTAPATYNEVVSARSEKDAMRQVSKILPKGNGVLSAHLATEEEIDEYEYEKSQEDYEFLNSLSASAKEVKYPRNRNIKKAESVPKKSKKYFLRRILKGY